MMIEKVKKTVIENNLFCKDTHVVLGLSGGPDSMCLFDVLCKLSKNWNLTIHPVHINHLFRPGAAEEDQAYVEKCCADRGLECKSFVYDCNRIAKEYGLTSEEAGRKARYQAFGVVASEIAYELKQKEPSPKPQVVIAVAQNAQDQGETILFRILRGTSVDGLAGIAYKRQEKLLNLVDQLPEDEWKRALVNELKQANFIENKNEMVSQEISLVRPLLDISREDIEEYCEKNNLNPRRDHTNEEALYTRNKIRLKLMPYLKENYNQNITETLNRLGRAAEADRDYLWQQAEKAFKNASCQCEKESDKKSKETSPIISDDDSDKGKIYLNVEKVAGLHKAIRYRVYNKALREIGMVENVSTSYLNQIDNILLSDSPSGTAELTGGYRVRRKYGKLVFSAGTKDEKEIQYHLKVLSIDEYKKILIEGSNHSTNSLMGAFDGDEIPSIEQVKVRKRKDGDYIWIKGAGKRANSILQPETPILIRKKLQDFLVDEKVPKIEREQLWVLARGSEVLWILPSDVFTSKNLKEKGRFSAKHKVNFCTDKNVIVLEII